MKAILLVLICAVLGLALQNYRLSERLARVEKATSQTTDTSEADLDRLRTRDALQEVVRGIMQSEAGFQGDLMLQRSRDAISIRIPVTGIEGHWLAG